jgi:hypothetical protein
VSEQQEQKFESYAEMYANIRKSGLPTLAQRLETVSELVSLKLISEETVMKFLNEEPKKTVYSLKEWKQRNK